LRTGRVVEVHQDLEPPFQAVLLAGILARSSPVEKLLEVENGRKIGKELRIGRVSLEVVGEVVSSVHLSCDDAIAE